jgi:hypothetical protein
MSRLLLSACAAALLSTAPALAQDFPQTGTPIVADAAQAPLALPGVQPAIPAPVDTPYPGVIRYRADVTDLERKIVTVTETIPVTAGALTLLYPEYLPGNHAATGPIQLISGVTVTGNGARIEWVRDTLQPYAFHLDIPRASPRSR